MARALITDELLKAIALIVLILGVTFPILSAMRDGHISLFWGLILLSILPALWLLLRMKSWFDDRRLARHMRENYGD